MKTVVNIAVLLCLLTTCGAGTEVIQYAKTRNVRTLSGSATDTTGAAIPDVQVCTMSHRWKVQLQCTTTDSQGRWSLPPLPNANTYELRFVKDGFDQVWIRVRVTQRKAAPFMVELPVAT